MLTIEARGTAWIGWSKDTQDYATLTAAEEIYSSIVYSSKAMAKQEIEMTLFGFSGSLIQQSSDKNTHTEFVYRMAQTINDIIFPVSAWTWCFIAVSLSHLTIYSSVFPEFYKSLFIYILISKTTVRPVFSCESSYTVHVCTIAQTPKSLHRRPKRFIILVSNLSTSRKFSSFSDTSKLDTYTSVKECGRMVRLVFLRQLH